MTGSDHQPERPMQIREDQPMQCPKCRRVGAQIRTCDAEPCDMQPLRDIADQHDEHNRRLAAVDGYQLPQV